MTDRTISALSALSPIRGKSLIELEQAGGNSRATTFDELTEVISDGIDRAGWATGTLGDLVSCGSSGWYWEMEQTFSLTAGQRLMVQANLTGSKYGNLPSIMFSKDAGTNYYRVAMQPGDGNLVNYYQGGVVAASGTSAGRTGRCGGQMLLDMAVHAASSNRILSAWNDELLGPTTHTTNDMTGGTMKVYISALAKELAGVRYRLLG